ncbi:hypothetical protein QLH51_04230 [Sphingomonas sp. 2R-10]|uniref:hypothetical protein n=1 Tax=Sphingomonas sp. 2R-10 TaxID=3045148 RepID=UPI0024BBA7A1|nr:hypothetical protein [Sphingomonas sp. 2R-10]MDJ0276012.1 hypothetical protein [Sphingomonas sp. 2R-10]
MSDPNVGTVIVNHIDELEAAFRYAHTTMQPMLEKAAASVIDDKRHELGWAGAAPADFDKAQWLAPEDWRMGGTSEEDEFYLSFSLQTTPCIDGHEPETWLGAIAGFAGAAIRLSATTDALGKREWKAFLKTQKPLLDDLVSRGFLYDPRVGDVALTVPINRQRLAVGFEEDTLDAALEPLARAIDRVDAARPTLDQLVGAIKRWVEK